MLFVKMFVYNMRDIKLTMFVKWSNCSFHQLGQDIQHLTCLDHVASIITIKLLDGVALPQFPIFPASQHI